MAHPNPDSIANLQKRVQTLEAEVAALKKAVEKKVNVIGTETYKKSFLYTSVQPLN